MNLNSFKFAAKHIFSILLLKTWTKKVFISDDNSNSKRNRYKSVIISQRNISEALLAQWLRLYLRLLIFGSTAN